MKMKTIVYVLGWLIVPFVATAVAEEAAIRYPRAQSEQDTRYIYHTELLKEALRVTTDKHGEVEVIPAKTHMNEIRVIKCLANDCGDIDVLYRPTSESLEKELTPVLIPLDKGLLGYRIFLIREDMQPTFSKIENLDQLKKFSVGQGASWGDVEIYLYNRFEMVTGTNYEGLFKMLLAKRFDFFPRGVEEAPVEYDARKDELPGLHVEETILLYYPFPRYMWFANSARGKRLAQRVHEGLEMMIKDGAFDRLFHEHKGEAIRRANLKNRRIFKIENPFLPPTAPLGRSELWYDPLEDPTM